MKSVLSVSLLTLAALGATSAFAVTDSTFVNARTVRDVQHVLNDRGFRTGVDGIMGPRTQNSVRAFQRANNLEPTGQLNRQTLIALGIQKDNALEPQYSAAVIRKIQETLDHRGFKAGPVDGILSDATQGALRAFQRSENLQETGRPNPRTLAALGIPPDLLAAEAERIVVPRVLLSHATVREVQRQLNSRGYRAGRVDGVMGHATRSALMEFQRTENLQPSGQLNPQTLAALGLAEASASVGASR